MSMVVERVGVDRVRERLAGLKRKKEQQTKDLKPGGQIETIEEIEQRLDKEEEMFRDQKFNRKKQKNEHHHQKDV